MNNASRPFTAITLGCLLAAGAWGTPAQAASPDLNDLAAASRFVVHSRVAKVEYRLADGGPTGRSALPYTLVTYDVIRPLRGAVGASSFTLRFVGGPDGRGRFMQASNVPVFQAGDEDILFVQGNGEKGCALADCQDGRFRILNGVVHDGTGMPVQGVEANRVIVGGEVPAELGRFSFPRPAFDDLMKNPEARALLAERGMSLAEARQRYEAEAPARIEMSMISGGRSAPDRSGGPESASVRPAAATRALSTDSFVARLGQLTAASLQSGVPFQSVDAEARIAAPVLRAAAPGAAPGRNAAPARSAADLAEERSLPQDNPAITRHKTP